MRCLAAVALLLVAKVSSQSEYWRVVNGDDAPEGKYLYIVSLQILKHNICAGTILNPYYILTAAHCVVNKLTEDVSVVYGVIDLNSIEQSYTEKVEKFIIHDEFSKPKYLDNDIALLKLISNLWNTNGNADIVTLPPKGFQVCSYNRQVTLIGWGRNSTNGVNQSHLQRATLYLFSRKYCRFRYNGKINSNQICSGIITGGKGQCSGDSGGPLLYKYNSQTYQIGIISWSWKPCASSLYPGVATSVSHYIDWIRTHSRKK